MNILLTNDDGISFIGLKALEDVLSFIADVYVVAPHRERSGSSQAITLWRTIQMEKLDERHFSVEGYPTDCVNIALHSDLFPKFDMIISGINKGVNLGADVYFSGTVAAARHAAIYNIPGIAISHDCEGDDGLFEEIAFFMKELIESGFLEFSEGIFYNINYPSKKNCPPIDLKIAPTGRRIYRDHYKVTKSEGRELTLDMSGSSMDWDKTQKESDLVLLDEGYITLTPLQLDSVNYSLLEKMQKIQDENKNLQRKIELT